MSESQDKILGDLGEKEAVRFLKDKGYKILQRNFRTRLGEIDIIAQDRDTLCFIEVKTRISHQYGSPLESITSSKQRKIALLALSYLKAKKIFDAKMRFDVITIDKQKPVNGGITLLQDAFRVDSF